MLLEANMELCPLWRSPNIRKEIISEKGNSAYIVILLGGGNNCGTQSKAFPDSKWLELGTTRDTKWNLAMAGRSSFLKHIYKYIYINVCIHTPTNICSCTTIHIHPLLLYAHGSTQSQKKDFLDTLMLHLLTQSQGYCTYSFWHYPCNARYKILDRCSEFVFNRPGGSECLFTDCVPAVCRYLNVQVLVPCWANRQPPTHFVYQE